MKLFLIQTQLLLHTDALGIVNAMKRGLDKLWPEGYEKENIRLVITDQAPTMVAAMRRTKTFFPNLKHITC